LRFIALKLRNSIFVHFVLIVPILISGVYTAGAQEIITADRYMEMVGERYGGIRDYEAGIAVRSGNTNMYGAVSHLSPSFLRIDFTSPANQVLVFDGELLTVYLPEYGAILNQAVSPGRRPGASGASLASAQGLSLLRRNYIPVFVTGPDPEPLEPGSLEMVVRLRLSRRSISEGFREIILNVEPDTRLIRRIEGRTIAGSLVSFDFSNIRVNQGIPEARFIYDSPASAILYNNFLFRDTD
jgi:outer membrane lipoprotein-sorting protein